jgi:ATP/maltotriose-dependent transcriptional regulator MalT
MLGASTMLEQMWSIIEIANLYLDMDLAPESAAALHEEARGIGSRWSDIRRLDRLLGDLGARLERTGPSDHRGAPPPRDVVARISTAELRVLHYLPSHYSLPRIAAELNLAASTVKTHCLAVYRKLGVDNRDDAVITARRLGLIRD